MADEHAERHTLSESRKDRRIRNARFKARCSNGNYLAAKMAKELKGVEESRHDHRHYEVMSRRKAATRFWPGYKETSDLDEADALYERELKRESDAIMDEFRRLEAQLRRDVELRQAAEDACDPWGRDFIDLGEENEVTAALTIVPKRVLLAPSL